MGEKRPSTGRISQDDIVVGTRQIVAPDGSYDPDAIPDLADEALVDLFRWLCLERRYSERAVALQRRGELGTFAPSRGQEASIVGSGYALADGDWLLGMGREASAMLMQGVSITDLLLFWRGIEEAGSRLAAHQCMIAIAIGSHLPLVTGIAWGLALEGRDAVAAAFFGDGATSTGAAHEALNFAGVRSIPALFYCQNNQYAISTPFEHQTGARTVAQRAVGYGIEGIRVDGNDVLAVFDAVSEARRLARDGHPVLVESVTYRLDAHTTSDDPTRYRDEAEVEDWRDRDPIDRYRSFLRQEGLWADVDEAAVQADIDEAIDDALETATAFRERDVDAVFDHLYADLPASLADQLDAYRALLAEHPEIRAAIEQRPKG